MLPAPLMLLAVSSSVSVVACVSMMVCFVLFEESRRCGRRILFYLHATDLLGAVLWLLTLLPDIASPPTPILSTPWTCYVQGYGLQFCVLSSYLWTTCFAFHLYQILVKANKTPEMYEWRYVLLAWGAPLLIVLMFMSQQLCGFELIGFGGLPWCWVRSWSDDQWVLDGYVLQMLFFYGPITMALAVNTALFLTVATKLGRSTVMSTGMEEKIRWRMMAYIGIFVLTCAWGGLGRTFQVISPEHEISPVFLALTAFFAPLQGALNCVTYGLNKLLRERFVSALRQWRQRSGGKGAGLPEKRTLVHSPKRLRRT
ncbi:hypothetical protein SDRG_06075 [Saprolegnia diclina VS20]|uniref:G-protein coupled receptors family 2 profile 2 domain-containing protein n=1 Tax=Saprolegnia diclina (strain VS20) TaxID=1156394 RepID=T0QPG4_SAPDV|nr:hypothetical protein SDRG_06075 [Saprolegnia diclina VS20]EQC36636.1 hypothetical protein SDRG_06075 [Saprolegnia diclina VS20]|eukprot:XP_008610058.1 hypothetical protein SDRG_06075 [Saprolegnia diclina VS20]